MSKKNQAQIDVPNNEEMERNTLGSILMDPPLLNEIAVFLKPSDFFLVRHEWIFAAMLRVNERDHTVDARLIEAELAARGQLDDVGGIVYLNGLTANIPTALNGPHYAREVERLSIRRRVLAAVRTIHRLAYDGETDVADLISKAQQAVFEISSDVSERGISWFVQEAADLYDVLESWRNNSGPQEMDTPLPDLNEILLGVDKGEVVVIAAGPKLGKTSLMLQWALHGAKQGKHGLIFSMEMSERSLMQRVIAQETGISTTEQRKMTDDQWKRFVDWFGVTDNIQRPLAFDKKRSHTAVEIAARCRQFGSEFGLDFIVIDYLQLMSTEHRGQNRNNELGETLRKIKELAMSMNIRVIIGSQFSRDFIRANRAPTLSDLRDSGEIEQHVDKAVFIHSPDGYDTDALKGNSMRELIVAAHRNGPTGSVPVTWLPERVKFVPFTPQKEPVWMVRDTSLTAASTAG